MLVKNTIITLMAVVPALSIPLPGADKTPSSMAKPASHKAPKVDGIKAKGLFEGLNEPKEAEAKDRATQRNPKSFNKGLSAQEKERVAKAKKAKGKKRDRDHDGRPDSKSTRKSKKHDRDHDDDKPSKKGRMYGHDHDGKPSRKTRTQGHGHDEDSKSIKKVHAHKKETPQEKAKAKGLSLKTNANSHKHSGNHLNTPKSADPLFGTSPYGHFLGTPQTPSFPLPSSANLPMGVSPYAHFPSFGQQLRRRDIAPPTPSTPTTVSPLSPLGGTTHTRTAKQRKQRTRMMLMQAKLIVNGLETQLDVPKTPFPSLKSKGSLPSLKLASKKADKATPPATPATPKLARREVTPPTLSIPSAVAPLGPAGTTHRQTGTLSSSKLRKQRMKALLLHAKLLVNGLETQLDMSKTPFPSLKSKSSIGSLKVTVKKADKTTPPATPTTPKTSRPLK